MKFVANKAFPYPVLSEYSDDYVNRAFQAALKFEVSEEGRPSLRIKCTVSDEGIAKLIKSARAEFAIEVNCSQTFLRRIKRSQEPEFQFAFEKGDLHGRVELNAFVICLDYIPKFISPNFNEEFGENPSFHLEPGNVLAVQNPVWYWWDTEQIQPISSVFELVESNQPSADSFMVSWEEQKIQVMMRKDEKIRFEAARKNASQKPFLLMSVYFPMLMQTLQMMAEPDSNIEEKKWFHAINYKLNEKQIELTCDSDFLEIAQKLLGMPLKGILPSVEV